AVYYLRQVFMLFVIAFFFAYILNPLVLIVQKAFKNKALSILSVYAVLFSMFLLLIVPAMTNIISEVSDIGVKMQRYSETFRSIYVTVIASIESSDTSGIIKELKKYYHSATGTNGTFEIETAPVSLNVNEIKRREGSEYAPWSADNTNESLLKPSTSEITLNYISKFQKLLKSNPQAQAFIMNTFDIIKDYLLDISLSILYGLMAFTIALVHYALVAILSFYFLEDFKSLWHGFCLKIPSHYRNKVISLTTEVDDVLGNFLRGQLIVCLIVGTTFSFSLFFIGVDFAFIIGPIAGFFNVIPYLGPIIALVSSLVIALLKWGLTKAMILKAMLIMISILTIHLIDAFGMQPYIADKSFNMHPLTLMLLLFIGLQIYGVLGMFLAIPIYGVGKVIHKEFKLVYE
ncbi:MAG TPA: AI-2E family transporter, partial [Candidatus Wallbacteria bacterium]|nr:AI-2E family transporter [Candidatus Wallbacteria bacterium]